MKRGTCPVCGECPSTVLVTVGRKGMPSTKEKMCDACLSQTDQAFVLHVAVIAEKGPRPCR